MQLEILRVGAEIDDIDADQPRCPAPESHQDRRRSATARVEQRRRRQQVPRDFQSQVKEYFQSLDEK